MTLASRLSTRSSPMLCVTPSRCGSSPPDRRGRTGGSYLWQTRAPARSAAERLTRSFLSCYRAVEAVGQLGRIAVPIEMYTVREIAQALKLAEKTVYSMAADGDLPAFKVRGQWRIRRTDFERWLGAQSGAVSQPDKHAANAEGDPMLFESTLENPVADLSERVPQAELHARLVSALG